MKYFFFLLLASSNLLFRDIFPNPKVAIITSVYKGDQFIEHFLIDITRQTMYKECEHIIINAASPGNEEPIILKHMANYPNIKYIKLETDPGLYGVWNLAIQQVEAPYIMNANLDDRLSPEFIQKHYDFLESMPSIDLVYSDHYWSTIPNETFEQNSHQYLYPFGKPGPDFSPAVMQVSVPGCHPMWRKTIHRYGFFDATFQIYGDWEYWCRAVSQGAVFKKLEGVYGLY